jgi:hypothetical protein
MSNLKILTSQQLAKIQQLNFLGSYEFPSIVNSYSLEHESHNYLMLAHILTIGFQSTGIKSGCGKINHTVFITKDGCSPPIPQLEFWFRITNDRLIQHDNFCTRSNINIHNKENIKFNYYNSVSFRNFLLEYQNTIFQSLPTHINALQSTNKLPDFTFDHENHKSKIDKIECVYEQIIEQHPIVSNFILLNILEKDYKNNKTKIIKSKI